MTKMRTKNCFKAPRRNHSASQGQRLYRTPELEIRGEVEVMRSEFEAKLAALTTDAEQQLKLQLLPSNTTKALDEALRAEQASTQTDVTPAGAEGTPLHLRRPHPRTARRRRRRRRRATAARAEAALTTAASMAAVREEHARRLRGKDENVRAVSKAALRRCGTRRRSWRA